VTAAEERLTAATEDITLVPRQPVQPMELRRFWTRQFQHWAKNRRRLNLGGTTSDSFRVAMAILGLLDNMRHDGALKGPHDFWTLKQLAGFMGMSPTTALFVLKWLEKMGCLISRPIRDELGHSEVSERYMRLPEPKSKC
jgi:hypothetical protein